jgi:hypothetical protein
MPFAFRHLIAGLGCFLLVFTDASAGEIAGIRSQLPPTSDPDVSINFSNDFLGRGGSTDDFRTSQLIVSSKIGSNWIALIDHSTLTLVEPLASGRIDQLSGSLGYRFVDRQTAGKVTRITAGSGFRAAGDFQGEPMQNGFHRIVGSGVVDLPYVDSSSTDITLWFDADHYAAFHTSGGDGFFGGWQSGYWLRASSLITSGSQWDNALGAYAVSSKNAIDIWLGIRRDWRSGYGQDFVQRATAAAEDDVAVVVGLRWGALVLETVQQINNAASYGQLKLVADGRNLLPAPASSPRFNVEFGIILPDVQVQLAAKLRSSLIPGPNSKWRESVFLDWRFGEPQYEDNANIYVQSRQLSLGMEWERPLADALQWISAYGSIAVGWRTERLLGDLQLAGEQSESVGKATALLNTGLRFAAANLGAGWRYRVQIGVTGWIPSSGSEVTLAGQGFRLHKTGFGLVLGMTFDYR